MKRRIKSIAILLVFFCLTACNQTETKSDDTKQVSGFAKTVGAVAPESAEGGVYLFTTGAFRGGSDNGSILEYWNLESDVCVPLCSKANCMHADETCDAWFKHPVEASLQKHGEKLYLWCGYGASASLYSVNLDGSGREKVCGFFGDRVADSVMSSIVVGDHCYVHMSYEQDRNGSDVDGVYRVSLKDGTAELIRMNNEDTDWKEHRLYDVVYDQGTVYYEIVEYRTGEARSRIFAYDEESRKDSLLFETDAVISAVVADNKLYYTRYQDKKANDKLFVFDLDTGEESVILIPYAGCMTYDGTWLYVANTSEENTGEYIVCDTDGNVVDRIRDGFEKEYEFISRITLQDQIVFMGENITENTIIQTYHIVNKSDIGNGEIHYYEKTFTD